MKRYPVNNLWLCFFATAILVLMLPLRATALADQTSLPGGTISIGMSDQPGGGPDRLNLDFVNNTGAPICDLHLDSVKSSGIAPDFEDDIKVYNQDGVQQVWNEDPAPADGVEAIKTAANAGVDCIPPGQKFTLSVSFDEVDDGDVLRIAPSDNQGNILYPTTPLPGGTTDVPLDDVPGDPEGYDAVSFTFENKTQKSICDLSLDTNPSSGIDPDFEFDISVYDQNGNLLDWSGTSPTGDGVETIKIKSNKIPDHCIKPGDKFKVVVYFDGIDAGDILRVAPTSDNGGVILASASGILPGNEFVLYNGYAHLPESTTGVFAGTVNTGVAISWLRFTSGSHGVNVISASSPLPSHFDYYTGLLHFEQPISPGAPIEFEFTVDQLLPFSEDDPDPFTHIRVESLNRIFLTFIGK